MDPRSHHVTIEHEGRRATRAIDPARGEEVRWRYELDPGREPTTDPGAELPPDPAEPAGRKPGWLGWLGGALALAGTAGVVGFGLRTRTLHDQYDDNPTAGRRDSGVLMRKLTNASIGVAAVGAVLVLLDVAFLRTVARD